ncbi:hypothetical protein GGI03_000560 [Coemansia sp. RSA 2337]|nr:hypothetical protein GGI08_000147 [Coemansia sp. S2]KAJ2075394.1 hypothetical protein GGH13_000648 [Coemansia sp. S155-1]KAJ2115521.1 hypothetical protein IW146_002253 [Coemansia sp. RSA 922]KAJ2469123.1 hypothetical protein GGI03_000560 [Coemansia sp. RSA 2337]
MVGRTIGEDGGSGGKGFSLFSAFNGLFERARSSAEKESQRLFTSPIPDSRVAKERRLDRPEGERTADSFSQEQYTTNSGSPRSTLDMAKRRPRPVRTQSSRTGTPSRKRPTPNARSPPVHTNSTEETTVEPLSPLSAAAIDDDAAAADNRRPHDAMDAPTPTPSTMSKRKRSVIRPPSPVLEEYADSPKRVRAGATDSYAFTTGAMGSTRSTPDTNSRDADFINSRAMPPPDYDAYGEEDYGAERHSFELARDSAAQPQEADVSAFSTPPVAIQRTSTVSTAVSDSTYRFRNDAPMPIMRSSEYGNARRAEAAPHRQSAMPRLSNMPIEKLELPVRQIPTIAEPSPVVERGRLEKVERELHRLKKIIASLLPDELNDDDLRSVYGDLDQHQPRRLSSDDIIMQLMKTRLGAGAQFSSRYNGPQSMRDRESLLNLPPSPTSNSPTNYGLSAGSMPPPSAPPPPPMAPPPPPMVSAAALMAGRSNLYHSQEATGRPRSVASLLRRDSMTSDATSSMMGDYQPVHLATVRRLRADLRPLPPKSQITSLQKKQTPPPPHKDPGVMTQLLEEMKHHKLRSVTKPKDMAIH